MFRRLAAILTVIGMAAASCSGPAETIERPLVIATTTMLGDVARNIVGGDGTVEVLMPTGADPHEFQASARQASRLIEADLVIVNGLGLEEGLEDVLDAARADGARILELGPLIEPIPLTIGDPGHDDNGSGEDPHFWLDPVRMALATLAIGGELATIAPDRSFLENAAVYGDRLLALDVEISELLADIPPERRKLVTNHAALGYFALRHDFEVVGVVIPGGSTLADPSSAELAALVATIRENGITTIFAETTEPESLADAVAAELGDEVSVVALYTGSLGEPGSEADTLIGMIRTDALRIAEALR